MAGILVLAQAQATASHAQAKEAHRSLLPSVAAVGDHSQFSVVGAPDAWSIGPASRFHWMLRPIVAQALQMLAHELLLAARRRLPGN